MIHEGEDDLGLGGNAESLITGNAGARLGCCIIKEDNDNRFLLGLSHHGSIYARPTVHG